MQEQIESTADIPQQIQLVNGNAILENSVQLAAVNHWVAGSSPAVGAIFIKDLSGPLGPDVFM